MDIQDPLRLRLMSHLQCFAAQRELASKQTPPAAWGYTPAGQTYPPLNTLPASPNHSANLISNVSSHQAPPPPTLQHQANVHDVNNHFDISTSCAQPTVAQSATDSRSNQPSSTSILTPLTTTTSSSLGYSHHQYHNLNSFSVPSSLPSSNASHIQNYNQSNSTVNMKPYRPWGAEVAY